MRPSAVRTARRARGQDGRLLMSELKRVLVCPYVMTWREKFHYVHMPECWTVVVVEEGDTV
jgi:hypothetical protein